MNREDPKLRLSNKKCKKVLLLGSSHGRGLHGQLHSAFGDEYAVTSIFKLNAALRDVVGDLRALSIDLTE
jgi:trans-2-enoyl-CoA reductase